jgi:hypothetical protein
MVYSFERRWKPDWDASLTELKINRNDLVTMASIVEKEARVAEERPVIAAVYYNRLRRGMRLQADPTVQFARGRHTERVLYKDLEIESPYNTYIHKGLPPGPIASPGVASLAAAAHPANVPYLYFVASRDGHHEFRMTLREHTNAIRQVRANAPAKKTKPLMLASAATKASPRRAARSTTMAAAKPAAKTAAKTPAKTTASRTSAKTASKVTAKAASKTTAKTASKTGVKPTPKKTTKSADTTKKRLAAAQTTHR